MSAANSYENALALARTYVYAFPEPSEHDGDCTKLARALLALHNGPNDEAMALLRKVWELDDGNIPYWWYGHAAEIMGEIDKLIDPPNATRSEG